MRTDIIHPDGVITGELERATIYGDGAHSRDLRARGLLPPGTKYPAHHVILPITTIESAVLELLGNGISQQDIISYAGVMAKAPNGTPSVHALWGPAAKANLKIAVAMETFDEKNVLMRHLLELMISKGVTIIETNKLEHDSKMAVIQGLINLWLVMVGECRNTDLQNDLIQHWQTPAGTIVDMIHANPGAEIVIKNFFESLERHGYNMSTALEESIAHNLTETDIEKFGTPNSHRVMEFINQENGRIVLSRTEVKEVQEKLNMFGHRFLTLKIASIRGK